MIEVDLNNGKFRVIDLDKPVFCVKCGNEIKGRQNVQLKSVIDVHGLTGYAFCADCKKKLNRFANPKLDELEARLVREFAQKLKNGF